MPKFKYVAIQPGGKQISGVEEAASAARVRNDLLLREYEVVSVKERKPFTEIEITTKKLKPADLMNFSRQLAAFLRAGIPILDALDALTDDTDNKLMQKVLVDIADQLRGGSTFSDAAAAHQELFPSYYIGILRSAELTGNLDVVLDQLARYIERDLEARRTLKSALVYPSVIFVMAIVTVLVMVTFVLPRFKTFFESFDAKLPLATRLLIDFADFIESWWPVLLGVFLVVTIGGYLYQRTESGRYNRDKLLLKMPAVGAVVQCASIERFCRILGSMLRAGVTIPEAMAAAADAATNMVYQRALNRSRERMLRGEGLARPLQETGLFPGAAAQMLKVGEESGTLDQQLNTAADYYESELGYKVKKLTTLFEPAVIVIMGLVVGFVAVALVSAMYGIFNQVKIK
jgi:type IV pilus assembly protein PilC